MPWTRMRFKGQRVWVHADAAGRPVFDAAGRAEMKYRESDERVYRPAGANLEPDAPAAPPRASRPAGSPGKARAAGRSRLDAARQNAVHVWTDGACSGNPGPMGIGVVARDGDRRLEASEYLGTGTNNVAELTAIERGLALARDLDAAAGVARPLQVYSDSSYAIGLLCQGWKAKANQELVARLRRQVDAIPRITFVKVPGHAGVPENERCDELARAAIARGR